MFQFQQLYRKASIKLERKKIHLLKKVTFMQNSFDGVDNDNKEA